jgi:excisionase family DNA binding protein
METLERNLITSPIDEQTALNKLEELLEESAENQSNVSKLELVGQNGERIELPDTVLQVLRQAVKLMLEDKAVSITAINKELTTQEAADLLNVSRPFLIKLLDRGEIDYRLVGRHRRIRFDDLMEYKALRYKRRNEAIQEMIQISEEAGLYEKDSKA